MSASFLPCKGGEFKHVMSVVTKIITDMKAQTPSHLADDVDNMMNYLIAWLCDYCEEANAHIS